MPILLRVLEVIAPLQSETITRCLEADSTQWDVLSSQLQNKEDIGEASLESAVIFEVYQANTTKAKAPISIAELNQLSVAMSAETEIYRHCEYQAAIAAAVVSH